MISFRWPTRTNGPLQRSDGTEVLLCEGRVDLDVVGESHYQEGLWRLVGGRRRPEERVRMDVYAMLMAETDNLYDVNAVSVWVQGLKVGYLSRGDAERYRPGLQSLEHEHGSLLLFVASSRAVGCAKMVPECSGSSSVTTLRTLDSTPCRAFTAGFENADWVVGRDRNR